MKMKKFATKFSAVVLMAVALTSCNKKTNTPPEADKEFQTSIDASAAQMIVTDIDMMVAQSSEYATIPFYMHASGSNPVNVNRNDTINKKITITFNNSKCVDGKTRNGRILIDFGLSPNNKEYIRVPGHISTVTFDNYAVGPYKIKNAGSSLKITNTTPAGYTRSVTPLTWKLEGEVLIMDTTKSLTDTDISWKGTYTKTLLNSTTSTIHPSTSLPIVWTTTNNAVKANAPNAEVSYSGEATGVTKVTETYKFKIDAEKPMVRMFGCSPDFYIYPGHHPFNKGKVKFETGGADKAVRTIYYGSEDNTAGCDNNGVVIINGISYSVDFKQ